MDATGLDRVLELFTGGLIIALIIAIVTIIKLVFWLLQAIARFRTLRYFKYDKVWMAFVPFLSTFAWIECCADKDEVISLKDGYFVSFPLMSAIYWVGIVCFIVPIFSPLFVISRIIVRFVTGYSYWKTVYGYDSWLLGILNVFLPIVQLVALLFHRFSKEVSCNE